MENRFELRESLAVWMVLSHLSSQETKYQKKTEEGLIRQSYVLYIFLFEFHLKAHEVLPSEEICVGVSNV
jgi:hypothetical protein